MVMSLNPEVGCVGLSQVSRGIADLLGVLEHLKFALNVAFFVRHEYFLHPKSGNLQEVSQESVHIYSVYMSKFLILLLNIYTGNQEITS